MRRHVPRPSPALVVASAALALSLTGTGLADVAQLGRNVVGAPQLRAGAVTTPKIRNRSVTLAKLAPSARIPGPRGPRGPQGEPGPQGPAGAPANIGPGTITSAALADGAVTGPKIASNAVTASKLSVVYRSVIAASIADGAYVLRAAACGPTEELIGGGAHWSGQFNPTTAADTHLVYSNRIGNSWQVAALNGSGSSRSLTVTAICVGG